MQKAIQRTDKGCNAAGNVVGVIGIVLALAPDVTLVTKIAGLYLATLGAASKAAGSTVGFVGTIVDPPDAAFQTVAVPAGVATPRVRAGPGLSRKAARAVNALSGNALRRKSIAAAIITAINRAQGAGQAGDDPARKRQLRAAAGFFRSEAKLIAAGPALRGRLAGALTAAHQNISVSRSRLVAAQRKIAASGLPAATVSTLRGLGLSDAEIRQYAQGLSQQPIQRGYDVAHVLRNPGLDASERLAAKGFQAQARALGLAAAH